MSVGRERRAPSAGEQNGAHLASCVSSKPSATSHDETGPVTYFAFTAADTLWLSPQIGGNVAAGFGLVSNLLASARW